MLINFVGSPASGKTTTAAMLFATLKEHGHPAEFISEYARLYIAEKKEEKRLAPEDHLQLTDGDQLAIMNRQAEIEATMLFCCSSSTLIISDGSPLNSLLYMTPEFRKTYAVTSMVKFTQDWLMRNSLTFFCHPLQSHRQTQDSNRIHGPDEIKKIDHQFVSVMKEVFTDPIAEAPLVYSRREVDPKYRWILFGNPQDRLESALNLVYMRSCQS